MELGIRASSRTLLEFPEYFVFRSIVRLGLFQNQVNGLESHWDRNLLLPNEIVEQLPYGNPEMYGQHLLILIEQVQRVGKRIALAMGKHALSAAGSTLHDPRTQHRLAP
jgi:hypothetical protein